MEPDKIIFFQRPELRQPDMVAAFPGWPDAAQVTTGAVSYMIDKLPADKLAGIESDDYYDFAAVRPVVNIEEGIMQPLLMPLNNFYYWKNNGAERDLILFTGIEPQMKWHSYVEAIANMAGYYNVHRIYAIGGLFDRIPHTRETHISGIVNNVGLLDMLNTLLQENGQTRNYLKALENQYDLEGSSLNVDIEGADQIIKDIEEFLRNQRLDQ